MKLTHRLVKAEDSGEHGCPAVYETDDPALVVVQGGRLAPESTAGLEQVAPDETAVVVPVEMLLRAAAAVAPDPAPAGVPSGDIEGS